MPFIKWQREPLNKSSITIAESDLSDEDSFVKPMIQSHVVLRRHTGVLLLRYWIHVLAVLSTAAAATLNFLEVFLIDNDDPNTVAKLNAFQFVARLHEAILVGSLILVLMDTVRTKLLLSDGVSLGHFLSPFTFTNFDFLASGQFWRSLQFKTGTFSISVLLVIAIPFANVAGPLSAITIVPRLGWSRPGSAAMFPTIYNASMIDFWPGVLNATFLPPECSENGAGLVPGCPSMGINQTAFNMDYASSPGALCLTQGLQSSCNVSVSSSLAANPISRLLSIDFSLDTTTAYASTPNAALYGSVARRFEGGVSFFFAPLAGLEFIDAKKTQLVTARYSDAETFYKSAVGTSCQELDYDSIVQLLTTTGAAINWTTPAVTWLNDAGSVNQSSFLFTYRADAPGLKLREPCTDESCYAAISCSIDARWSAHDLWYNTGQPGLLYTNDPQPRQVFESSLSSSRPILLRQDWLRLITNPGAQSMPEVIVSLLNSWNTPRTRKPEFLDRTIQENIGPTNHTVAVAIIVSGTLAESLAQLPLNLLNSIYNGNCSDTRPGFTFPPEVCAQTPIHWVRAGQMDANLDGSMSMITFNVRRSGYGWFMNSIVVKIALAVLLFHALATGLYLILILVTRKTICTRWPSAAELVVLAIDSFRAPDLIGSTIKAQSSDLWRKRVTLREVDYGDRLSLIVGDSQQYPERVGTVPALDKRYS